MPLSSHIVSEQRYPTRSTSKENKVRKTSEVNTTSTNITQTNQGMATPPAVSTITSSDIPDGSMEAKMDFLISKVLAINTDTSNIIENQLQQMQTLTGNVNNISLDVANMKLENTALKVANATLTEKLISLECYSRLNNLILRNVPEEQGSTTVMATVTKILTDTMKIANVSSMLFDDVHRKGLKLPNKCRPIYFRLVRRIDRHTIWSNRFNLKGTTYVIHEDLPVYRNI
jgi:hypothetical protein